MNRRLTTTLALTLLGPTLHAPLGTSPLHAQALATQSVSRESVPERSIAVQLLLRDGSWRGGRLASLDVEAFTFSGAAGDERIMRNMVVACLVGSTLPRDMAFLTQLTAGTLVLDDGQLLPGDFRLEGARASWQHRWIGAIPIDLDRVSEIRFRAESRAAARADADTVLLLNGDAFVGFVDSIGSDLVLESLEPAPMPTSDPQAAPQGAAQPKDSTEEASRDQQDGGSDVRRIPTERVAAIAFAQVRESAGEGIAIWMADGTHVRADAIEFDGERGWIFGLADPLLDAATQPEGSRPIASSPIALVFDQGSIHPLAACDMSPADPPSDGYRYAMGESVRIEDPGQSLLGLGQVTLDGCMRVRIGLPDALVASRAPFVFTAEVSLAEPAPADAAVELVATIGGEVAARARLDETTRRSILTIDATAMRSAMDMARPEFTLALSDGGNGTAGDRVVLRRAMFLRTN